VRQARATLSTGKFATMNLINSAAELDKFGFQTRIAIEFPSQPRFQIKIKHRMNSSNKPALASIKKPFAELILHPEKLDAILEGTPERSVPAMRKGKISAKAESKSSSRPARPPRNSLKKTIFSLKADNARSVRWAGDFTNWEKAPIEMSSADNGNWSAVISLQPGCHSYRFLVDGEWQDDPLCTRRLPNPFDTENAVIEII
jgi:hypothetical protein